MAETACENRHGWLGWPRNAHRKGANRRARGRGRAVRRLTATHLPYNMSDMPSPTVSVRALQQNLKSAMARAEQGQVIEVTRRRRPVARLSPIRPAATATAWPNLEARTKAVFGDRRLVPGAAQIVVEARAPGSPTSILTSLLREPWCCRNGVRRGSWCAASICCMWPPPLGHSLHALRLGRRSPVGDGDSGVASASSMSRADRPRSDPEETAPGAVTRPEDPGLCRRRRTTIGRMTDVTGDLGPTR